MPGNERANNSLHQVPTTELQRLEILEPSDSITGVNRDSAGNLVFTINDSHRTITLTREGARALRPLISSIRHFHEPRVIALKGREGHKYLIEKVVSRLQSKDGVEGFFEKRLGGSSDIDPTEQVMRGELFVKLYGEFSRQFQLHGWSISELLLATDSSNYFQYVQGTSLDNFLSTVQAEMQKQGRKDSYMLLTSMVTTMRNGLVSLKKSLTDYLLSMPEATSTDLSSSASTVFFTINDKLNCRDEYSLFFDFMPPSVNNFVRDPFFHPEYSNWLVRDESVRRLVGLMMRENGLSLDTLKENLICVDPFLLVRNEPINQGASRY